MNKTLRVATIALSLLGFANQGFAQETDTKSETEKVATVVKEKAKPDNDEKEQAKEAQAKEAQAKEAEAAKKPKNLGIGSPAPALDIEHWISNRDGHFKEVTKFEKDKVYIVEFWATWCGPCISAMPHVADLQTKYLDTVQVISISDEPLPTIERFLKRNVRGKTDQTYGELTSSYCLTTDPDKSSNRDYMRASKQNGIPTAFIVGKSGLVEWIGHPMAIDDPLEAVVNDKWDLDKAQKEFVQKAKFNEIGMSLNRLMRTGKIKKAVEFLDGAIEKEESPDFLKRLRLTKLQVLNQDDELAEQTAEFAKTLLGEDNYNSQETNMLTWFVYEQAKAGKFQDKETLQAAVSLAESKIDGAGEVRPMLLDTVAHLYDQLGDSEKALQLQEEAFETAPQNFKATIKEFLDELKARDGKDADESDSDEDDE